VLKRSGPKIENGSLPRSMTSWGLIISRGLVWGYCPLKFTMHIIIIIYEVSKASDDGFLMAREGIERATVLAEPTSAPINYN